MIILIRVLSGFYEYNSPSEIVVNVLAINQSGLELVMDRKHSQHSPAYLGARYYSAWELIKLIWQSKQKLRAYLALVLITIMTIALVALDVGLSYWSNYFYDALQAYNKNGAIYLLKIFFLLAFIYMVLFVYRYYVSQLFGLRWRRWLTEQFIGRWLQKRDYYYMETFEGQTDNPDQRIQEDVGALAVNSISLFIGLIASITSFFAFIYVLWSLSGKLHIHFWGMNFNIPGYLVWVAIAYAAVGSYFTYIIGHPLIPLNFEQQRREASFRFAAIDLRSHAEHVALYKGEHHQKTILHKAFHKVLDNWYLIILRQKALLWFTAGYNQVAVALPLLVVMPNYFGKVFLLGGLMQSLRAFSQVQEALSYFVTSFTQIAEWRAITQRLTTFLNHLQDIDTKVTQQNHLAFRKQPQPKITMKQLSISTPAKEKLLENINEEFLHGKDYLIKGESGAGKSTLVRTLAGIWPYAAGEINLPEKQRLMYLPQKSYMPIGTLAEAILFPDKTHPELEKHLEQVLQDCRLENFIPRLQETASWSEQFSPGEQQRIAFARILLHKPDWVFLDESTSMLDLENEKHLYQLLKNKLPHCSIVSVGHRPSLDAFHEHIIDVAKYQ